MIFKTSCTQTKNNFFVDVSEPQQQKTDLVTASDGATEGHKPLPCLSYLSPFIIARIMSRL